MSGNKTKTITPKSVSSAAQPNQSLIDGIATLQALATSEGPIGGRELARRLGLEPTRVNRLLKTLASQGIAQQTKNRKYTSGPGMHVLAAQALFASGLIRTAIPVLETLKKKNFTVAMGVLWRDNVSYLYHASPKTPATSAIGRIGLYPATTGGIGLALLAAEPDDVVRDTYIDVDEIPGFPDGVEELLATLSDIRQNGYARLLVIPEKNQHTVSVMVNPSAHAAIGVSGQISEKQTAQIVEMLHEAADKISLATGGDDSDSDMPFLRSTV